MLKGVNIYLIGMMGAGKTTVGRLLARELNYRFFDTDEVIVRVAGKSITDIFATAGEEEFRNLETSVLAELSAYKNLAIATGGGIVLRQMNWSYLQHGIVVWLDASVELLYERLHDDTSRPLLQDKDLFGKLQTLLKQRELFYAQADVRVSVDKGNTPEEVVARVLDEVKKVLRPSLNEQSLN